MSVGILYRCEWTDDLGGDWRIDIAQDDYIGQCNILQAEGDPLSIEHYGNDDVYEQHICGSTATLRVDSPTDFSLMELATSNRLEYPVKIYRGLNLIDKWSNNITHPYETFHSIGARIIAAINSSINGAALSNTFSVIEGEKILAVFRYNNISGNRPRLILIDDGWTTESSGTISDGWNFLEFTSSWMGNAHLILWEDTGNSSFNIDEVYAVRASQLHWQGYIMPDSYQEPYDAAPYWVTISANDSLGLLKDYKFKELGYSGRQTAAKILYDSLAKVGINGFTEYINIYDYSMDGYPIDSPLDQLTISPDVFLEYNLYEVVSEILDRFNSCIKQDNGKIIIERIVEIKEEMNGREFSSETIKTSVGKIPDQKINRIGDASLFHDVNGGTVMFVPGAKSIKIYQDYGSRDSWIRNYNFEYTTGGILDEWVYSAIPPNPAYLRAVIPSEKEGISLQSANSTPHGTRHIYQSFAPNSFFSDTDTFVFSFDYLLYNIAGAIVYGVDHYIKIKADYGNYWLKEQNADLLVWDDEEQFIKITQDAPIGTTGWQNYARRFIGLPIKGSYTITIYNLETTFGYVVFGLKNFKFICDSASITYVTKLPPVIKLISLFKFGGKRFKKLFTPIFTKKQIYDKEEITYKEWKVTNDISGIEIEKEAIIGDVLFTGLANNISQFYGALAGGVASRAAIAKKFVDNSAAGGVVVTSLGDDIFFTAQVAGVNFTGETSITNLTGSLWGSVAYIQANRVSVQQRTVITLTGTNGVATLSCNGVSENAIYVSSRAQAATDFVAAHAAAFAVADVTIGIEPGTSNEGIYFNPLDPVEASIVNFSGDLNGVKTQYDYVPALKRIDRITLTGTDGSANILCDGTTREAKFDIFPTSTWSSRDGAEEEPLIKLMLDELKTQYSRTKQVIDISVREVDRDLFLSLTGNLQDSRNRIGDNNRIFAISRSFYSAKKREYLLTLTEII